MCTCSRREPSDRILVSSDSTDFRFSAKATSAQNVCRTIFRFGKTHRRRQDAKPHNLHHVDVHVVETFAVGFVQDLEHGEDL